MKLQPMATWRLFRSSWMPAARCAASFCQLSERCILLRLHYSAHMPAGTPCLADVKVFRRQSWILYIGVVPLPRLTECLFIV